jgi:hypothetical protein
MKALFAMLAILAGLVLGAPSSAQAAVTCVPVSGQSGWPNGAFTEYCSNVPYADATYFQSALNQPRYASIPNFYPTAQFYLFHTEQDYISYGTAAKWSDLTVPASTAFGITDFDSNGNPVRTAVFEINEAGVANSDQNGNGVPGNTNQVANQAAQWIDPILANVTPGATKQSLTSDFAAEVTYDWTTFNTLNACYNAAQNSYGIFSQHEDLSGNYICTGVGGVGHSLSVTYSSLAACAHPANPSTCNQAVLEAAWPAIFGTNTEIFDESVAYGSNNNQLAAYPKDYDVFFENAFTCTGSYNNALTEFDTPPTANQLSAGCPVPAVRIYCTRTFDGTTNFPGNGYIENCYPGNGEEQNLSSQLANLGGSSTNPLLTTLKDGNYKIYVFHDYADYIAVFQKLGIPVAGNLGGAAYTLPLNAGYPVSIYTAALVEPAVGSVLSQDQLAEIIAHEIGHATDYLRGWASNSGSATFDKAMQWDFLNLDYNNQNLTDKKLPCGGTDKEGHNYTGPLAGLYDFSTGQANTYFCTNNGYGNALVNPGQYSALLNHQIVQYKNAASDYAVGGDFFVYTSSGTVLGQKTYPGGWPEWYAQAFAIQVDQHTNGGGYAVDPDMIVTTNSMFQCTAAATGYLAQVYAGQTSIVLPAACTATLPTGWVTVR